MNEFFTAPKFVYRLIFCVILLIAGIITLQNVVVLEYNEISEMGSFYNNYLIFKHSFFHLLANTNLYITYPEVQVDVFKYSPTFALIFGLFSGLPDILGLYIWNIANALVFYAVLKVRFPAFQSIYWVSAYLFIEYITNIQNSQSNGLMAGLMILSYVFMERKQVALATLMVVCAMYIKIFGVICFVLFLCYPDKLKAIAYSVFWMVVLFALPLLVISPQELMVQYYNWYDLLRLDRSVPYGLSFMGWLKYWFGFTPSQWYTLIVAVIFLCIPLLQVKEYKNPIFRRLIMSYILIWVVLFNHKSESPTFIIAIAGVALWFFSLPKSNVNRILLFSTVLFTQLAPSDIFSIYIRETYFIPYVIKVVPIILVWFKIEYDLIWTVKADAIQIDS